MDVEHNQIRLVVHVNPADRGVVFKGSQYRLDLYPDGKGKGEVSHEDPRPYEKRVPKDKTIFSIAGFDPFTVKTGCIVPHSLLFGPSSCDYSKRPADAPPILITNDSLLASGDIFQKSVLGRALSVSDKVSCNSNPKQMPSGEIVAQVKVGDLMVGWAVLPNLNVYNKLKDCGNVGKHALMTFIPMSVDASTQEEALELLTGDRMAMARMQIGAEGYSPPDEVAPASVFLALRMGEGSGAIFLRTVFPGYPFLLLGTSDEDGYVPDPNNTFTPQELVPESYKDDWTKSTAENNQILLYSMVSLGVLFGVTWLWEKTSPSKKDKKDQAPPRQPIVLSPVVGALILRGAENFVKGLRTLNKARKNSK